MAKSLRFSEIWYRRLLWGVSIIFAWFLSGLGSSLVGDLPKVEQRLEMEAFMDPQARTQAEAALNASVEARAAADEALAQAQLKLNAAREDTATAESSFSTWVAARKATENPAQDAELIRRTAALDAVKAAERKALAAVEQQRQAQLNAIQEGAKASEVLQKLRGGASETMNAKLQQQELRVFGYRLMLTLPLLVAAGWLYKKYRKGTWWPFVWGFIIFALFTFFVELVPYLPSYGGYVRNLVGIIVTLVVGRQAILALNRYLEKKQLEEQKSDTERRRELGVDHALARLGQSLCPGCERPIDLKSQDYCPNCGICLNEKCTGCGVRKNAFSRFCYSCGVRSTQGQDGAAAKPA